jgi:ABC-type dipeptide/oligopeptide/nickel transport system permease component
MLTGIFLLANLAADLVYALIDPRIRFDGPPP